MHFCNEIVRTSELNIAVCASKNYAGFISSSPILDSLTKKRFQDATTASDSMGFHYMALIVQAGIARFDLEKIRHIQSGPPKRARGAKPQEEEVDGSDDIQDNISNEDNDSERFMSIVEGLERNNKIPDVKTILYFLKNEFKTLTRNEFVFLQSVLRDLYTLQEWTQPLDYDEEKNLIKSYQSKDSSRDAVIIDKDKQLGRDDPIGGLRFPTVPPKNVISVRPSNLKVQKNTKQSSSVSSTTTTR